GIVLIPRWGIRTLTYINSLIRPFDRGLEDHSKLDELVDATSNVTSLKDYVLVGCGVFLAAIGEGSACYENLSATACWPKSSVPSCKTRRPKGPSAAS